MLPTTMSARAMKSYFQLNFSPRKQIANRELEMIAVAVLHDKRTISANGRTSIRLIRLATKLTSMDEAAKPNEKEAEYPVAGAKATVSETLFGTCG